MGWGVSKQDGLLVYWMWCSFRGWGACIVAGVLVNGMGITFRDDLLVYGMGC